MVGVLMFGYKKGEKDGESREDDFSVFPLSDSAISTYPSMNLIDKMRHLLQFLEPPVMVCPERTCFSTRSSDDLLEKRLYVY